MRVVPAEVPQLREDLENGRRFDALAGELASLAIEQGRAQRAAQKRGSGTGGRRGLKNSRRSASRKDTAKPKPSSRRCAKRSRSKG